MLSVDVLRSVYPAAPTVHIDTLARQSETVLPEFGITGTRNRLHFFLAQIGHESGGLTVREENLSYSAARLMIVWKKRFPTLASTEGFAHNPEALANKVYGGRMGNDRPGDGWRYRGRGYIQITGKDGYHEVGSRAGLDLVGSPDLAIDPKHCLRIACAFWQWKKLNPKCDQGDFVAVTKTINGGTVGLKDRFAWLEKVQANVPWPTTDAPKAAELDLSVDRLEAVQERLKALGLYDGSIDGIIGKRSRAALRVFQAEQGLPRTGRIDEATLEKLGV